MNRSQLSKQAVQRIWISIGFAAVFLSSFTLEVTLFGYATNSMTAKLTGFFGLLWCTHPFTIMAAEKAKKGAASAEMAPRRSPMTFLLKLSLFFVAMANIGLWTKTPGVIALFCVLLVLTIFSMIRDRNALHQ